jgi:hypothetical protein
MAMVSDASGAVTVSPVSQLFRVAATRKAIATTTVVFMRTSLWRVLVEY